jgi:hypothetical protein
MDFNPDTLQALLEQDLSVPFTGLAEFRSEALKKSLLKKFVPKEKASGLNTVALENFKALNEKVMTFSLDEAFLTTDVFLEWKRVIDVALHSGPDQAPRYSLRSCFANGMCGPGASVGSPNNLFFTKMFDCSITTTSVFLYEHYHHSLNPRWRRAEEYRLLDHKVKVVPGSKMSTVPKDRTKNRTICTEPILNMFYQLGMKTQLESVLLDRFNIDLSTMPDLNKRLARLSSIDGSLATIDLKDASDSISVELCRQLLPPKLFQLLMYIRSPRAHVGTELVTLAMISTMGNGFTFALMTLLFASLVRAIYNLNNIRYQVGTNVGVFGDDIIIVSEHADLLIDTLDRAGLVVNLDKSFTTGFFRESCGGDYFHGQDVRGIYIKKMSHETHVYSAFNRLHLWSLANGIRLDAVLQYLRRRADFRPVPYDAGVASGFIVTTKELTASHQRGKNNGSLKYHGYRYSPPRIEKCGDRFRNHHGGLISFLGGYVRNDQMELRVAEDAQLRYVQVVAGETPSWDFITNTWLDARDLSDSWSRLLLLD